MKWKSPEIGEIRKVTRFLFFPLEIQDEVRWLEFTSIVQKYNEGYDPSCGYSGFYWENIGWGN